MYCFTVLSLSSSHIFKVTVSDGPQYCFLATSKDDMLQWVESVCSSKTLDPSPLLLYLSGGAVIHTGFTSCQEFACNASEAVSPSRLQRKISDANFSGTFAAIDYGKHWTVLRSSGLVQCLVKGLPETLFNLATCQRVKVNNPREMREGVDYCIEVENAESKFVLRADLPTEHCDWVLAIERVMKKLDHAQFLEGHRKRESGYVALKRLLLMDQPPQPGNGRASQLYCFPRMFDDMEDLYEQPPKPSHPPPPKEHPGPRSELLHRLRPTKEEPSLPPPAEANPMPLPPKDYHPPPLPPRKEVPPPLPPKLGAGRRPCSTLSSGSFSDPDDDYIMMQSSRSSTGPSPLTTPIPSSQRRCNSVSQSPSQPIMIPNRRHSKKSVLLRADSESSTSPTHTGGSSLYKRSVSNSSSSFQRQNSNQNSNQSLNSSSYNNAAMMMRQVSVSSVTSETPPLPPRNGEKRSSGYASPIFYPSPSPGCLGGKMTQSSTMGGIAAHSMPYSTAHAEVTSKSDGMTVHELQQYHRTSNGRHPISKAGSMSVSSFVSEGYESDHSASEEDLAQVHNL